MNDRPEPVEAARAVVEERFPECGAALVAGSFLRGQSTPTSDLDIVIVTTRETAPFRESVRAHGWPVELFVHTEDSLRRYFAMDVERRAPSLPFMCSEGVVLRDVNGLAGRVKAEAQALLDAGPPPLTPDEALSLRYGVTDLLDDLLGTPSLDEGIFVAAALAERVVDLILAAHRRWTGHGKWAPRALARFDPELASGLTYALIAYCRDGNQEPLVQFTREALDLLGGPLFEGYRAGGVREDT